MGLISSLLSFGKNRKALVLSGGAARGFAHIGVIKVLQENNIQFDAVFGTSMGAVVGAMYCAGMSWQQMYHAAESFKLRDILNFRISRMGLIRWENVQKHLSDVIGQISFNSLRLPLFVIAVDMNTGNPKVFNSGDLLQVVCASSAIPGIITPVPMNGSLYVDGGVLQNFPVEIARSNNYKQILGVNVQSHFWKKDVENLFDLMVRAIELQNRKNDDDDEQGCKVLLRPELADYSPADYRKASDIMEAGAVCAMQHLSAIRRFF